MDNTMKFVSIQKHVKTFATRIFTCHYKITKTDVYVIVHVLEQSVDTRKLASNQQSLLNIVIYQDTEQWNK